MAGGVGLGGSPTGVLPGDAGLHVRGHGTAAGSVRVSPAHTAGLDVWYRIPGGRRPDVLEIGLRGKRRPRVEAYWDGCLYAL